MMRKYGLIGTIIPASLMATVLFLVPAGGVVVADIGKAKPPFKNSAVSEIYEFYGKFARRGECWAAIKHFRAKGVGDTIARFVSLGKVFENGDCGAPAYEKARINYNKAIALGDCEAELRLGRLYLLGLGRVADVEEARRRFRDAAICFNWMYHDDELTQVMVKSYYPGEMPQVLLDEIEWARRIGGGDARVQYDLALRIRDGIGFRKNSSAANVWIREAARKGLSAAKFTFGLVLLDEGRQKLDFKGAIFIILEAANAGYVPAQKDLGLRHMRGDEVVQRDNRTAYFWLKKAEAGGADVAGALAELEAVMTDNDKLPPEDKGRPKFRH